MMEFRLNRSSKTLICIFFTAWMLSFVALGFPQDQNNIPRANRGSIQVQNSKISTARGFGKRDNGLGSWNWNDENVSKGIYPNSILIDEIQNNPELIRTIVDKLIDINGDGELTQDELLQRKNSYK